VSGISARIGTFALAKQVGKGTPAAAPTTRFLMAGAPSLAPTKERGRFAMTDAGRDPGPGYTSRMGVEGDVPLYLHPDGFALLAAAALGTNADSGAGDPWTHTATPANDGMWLTCWRQVGNVIWERFDDCKISALKIEGDAGAPMMCTLSLVGIKSTFLASDPVLAALSSAPYIYPEAAGAIKIDTVSHPIDKVSFEINNNMSAYQADDYAPNDIDPGAREISLSLGVRFTGPTAFPKYREFFYGTDAGTAQSPVVGSHAFLIKLLRQAAPERSIQIDLPAVTYAGIPVQPDPGGAPIHVDLACAVEKPAGGGAICTITTKDGNTTIQ
jgi:Phage tail tube protein